MRDGFGYNIACFGLTKRGGYIFGVKKNLAYIGENVLNKGILQFVTINLGPFFYIKDFFINSRCYVVSMNGV